MFCFVLFFLHPKVMGDILVIFLPFCNLIVGFQCCQRTCFLLIFDLPVKGSVFINVLEESIYFLFVDCKVICMLTNLVIYVVQILIYCLFDLLLKEIF